MIDQSPGRPAGVFGGVGLAGDVGHDDGPLHEQHDSLGTASADGQPYIQHRGGPKGFLKVVDGKTLAFADFKGNRQYITAGNLSENDKAYIFLMDYANRRRIKIWGRARVVDGDAGLLERLADAGYEAVPEQAVVFEVEAWDVNCPQHITPRFTEPEVASLVGPLQARIGELEAQVAALRGLPAPGAAAPLAGA